MPTPTVTSTTARDEAPLRLALRPREAAEAIGVSVKTLSNWRTLPTPKGPRFCRINNSIFYRVADLDEWLARHVVE